MDKLVSFFSIFKDAIFSIGRWIETHSSFVSAASTAAIAFFTLTLWCATRKLWKVSQEQSRDMKTSLTIAQEAADAAKKSADALPAIERAYLFTRVKRHPPPKPRQLIENIKEGFNQARFIVINQGKTPAIITKIDWHVGVMNDMEIDDKISQLESNSVSKVPYGIITISSGGTGKYLADCHITNPDIQKINASTAYYVCLGRIEYKDVFRRIRKTVFCWKDNGVFFVPDENPKRNERT